MKEGTTQTETECLMTFAEFNELIGVDEKYALEERFGGSQQEAPPPLPRSELRAEL
jgi:hypothetical protein